MALALEHEEVWKQETACGRVRPCRKCWAAFLESWTGFMVKNDATWSKMRATPLDARAAGNVALSGKSFLKNRKITVIQQSRGVQSPLPPLDGPASRNYYGQEGRVW